MRSTIATVLSLAALLLAVPAPAGAGLRLPAVLDDLAVSPGIVPPGVNPRACRPPAHHPHPVVLLHGVTGSSTETWWSLAPPLVRAGYCVYALDYGHRGLRPMEESARELAAFVERVRRATAAAKVALVGYSQGGLMPRYYLRSLGGADVVDELVAIAPPNHGTDSLVVRLLDASGQCAPCVQARPGSAWLARLNEDETPGDVDHTVLASIHDDWVTPYRTAFLRGPAGRVTNVRLQDACPGDRSNHLLLVADPVVGQWVGRALAVDGPADPGFRPRCT